MPLIQRSAQHRIRRTAPLLAASALVLAACGGGTSAPQPSVAPLPSQTSAPSAPAPSTTASPGAPPTATSPPGASTTAPPPLGSPVNQPLWPFGTLAQAQAWEQAFTSGGQQPWHLDAGQTALAFTKGYLGFADIDRVTSVTIAGRDAHIGVGFATPSVPAGTATAAVVHLVRYGADADAPWEVVGTADTTLTLTAPAYGAKVASPLAVGGRITGVDESIRVQIRQLSTAAPLADRPGLPAGGSNSAWSTSVPYTGATDPVLTVVASTGGHLMAVERFAVTAVRTR